MRSQVWRVCECLVVVLMLDATAPTFSSVTTCAHLCPVPMVTTLPRIAPAAEHQAEHRQASLTLGLWNILTFHDIHIYLFRKY